MENKSMLFKEIQLPIEIPAEMIALPTHGATVIKCTYFHKGDKDTGTIARQYGMIFPVDTYKYEGIIHAVDPDAPDICFEAGMPVNWNGKLIQQGGGGVNGYVPPCTMPLHGQRRGEDSALAQGYIVFGSDSGHSMNPKAPMNCEWIRNQECFENFAYLSLKKTKDVVMYLTEIVYNTKPERVYFYGGSNGGRECMKAIQNFPEDYNGAVCFFPVLYWVLKVLMDVRNGDRFEELGEASKIDAESYRRVEQVIMEICSESDGEKEHLISNFKEVTEKRTEIKEAVQKVLSAEQFEMLKQLSEPLELDFPLAYGDVVLPGYNVFEGTSPVVHFSTTGFKRDAAQLAGGDSLIANVIAKDPEFDTHHFRPNDWRERIQEVSRWMDAYDSDLDSYKKSGGKLILVQGACDPQVTMEGSVQYYDQLAARYGKSELAEFMKFYLAPGYGHGTDGAFIITADFVRTLDQWVERGLEPGELIVEDRNPDSFGRRRTLCEYQ